MRARVVRAVQTDRLPEETNPSAKELRQRRQEEVLQRQAQLKLDQQPRVSLDLKSYKKAESLLREGGPAKLKEFLRHPTKQWERYWEHFFIQLSPKKRGRPQKRDVAIKALKLEWEGKTDYQIACILNLVDKHDTPRTAGGKVRTLLASHFPKKGKWEDFPKIITLVHPDSTDPLS